MPTTRKESTPWLPQKAYDRLNNELEHLCGPGRQETATRLEAARADGNPEENSAYLTILEEQAKNEGRILELKGLLETARVGQSPPDNGIVEVGMVVDVTVADQDIRFLFGNRQISKDFVELTAALRDFYVWALGTKHLFCSGLHWKAQETVESASNEVDTCKTTGPESCGRQGQSPFKNQLPDPPSAVLMTLTPRFTWP